MCLSFIVISIPYFSDKPVIGCLIIARCIIVILNVYSSIWKFQKKVLLKHNEVIEAEIQKGFTPKMVGVLEHTSMMTNIIDKARINQRSVVITFLDLKNALHHTLIKEVLFYHHIPAPTKN